MSGKDLLKEFAHYEKQIRACLFYALAGTHIPSLTSLAGLGAIYSAFPSRCPRAIPLPPSSFPHDCSSGVPILWGLQF
jgi:hypothetical protein